MAKMWYDKDVSLDPIKNETIAVIGFGGRQGNAQALNLRDSGLKVIVGAEPKEESRKRHPDKESSWEKAEKEGFEVYPIAEAARKADILLLLVPDMVAPIVYQTQIAPHLRSGQALDFAHGFNIHFKQIKPPRTVDVIMVAPKGPGDKIRQTYLEGFGTPALVAVKQNATGRAWERVLAIAKGIGATRPGVVKTTFKEETETDLFGEQVFLCAAPFIKMLAFDVLIEAGFQPEVAYFEVGHERKLLEDIEFQKGLVGMWNACSETARYGSLTRGPFIYGDEVKKAMKQRLREIQSGKFAREWIAVWQREGKKAFEKPLEKASKHKFEVIGRKLRKLMWPGQEIQ
jgi:ketol-acid reductoisomerase